MTKILLVPYSEGSLGHNIGCANGPKAIAGAMKFIWSSESGKPTIYLDKDNQLKSLFTVEELKIKSYEDIYPGLVKADADIIIGGDHSISYASFKQFASRFKNPGIVVFDAHPDVFSEHNTVKHQDWLKYLVEERILKPKNVIVLGIRAADMEEIDYFKKKGIRYFTAKEMFGNSEDICDSVMEMSRDFDGLYVSIDIDAVDPAFAPGTGYIEPAGLSSRELIYFIQRLRKLKNFRKVDIVEVNPDIDVNGMTVKLAAKIIGELV